MKKKILLRMILAMSITLSLVLYYVTNGNYNTYDIKHPLEGKQHAIIQIKIFRKIDDVDGVSTCSAFVIDKTRAVTAAHCVWVTKRFIKNKLPAILKESYVEIREMNKELTRLKMCPAPERNMRIIQIESKIKRELEARELLKKPDVFKVSNIYGEDTGIRATASFKSDKYRDYAVLEGDFKDFEALPLRTGFRIKKGDLLRSCGYAGGAIPPTCIDFIAVGNNNFMYKGYGLMIKGMSGGPVIDKYGFAVGINSAVSPDFMFIDTLIGIFNRKFERPKKKAKKSLKLRAKDK